MQKYQSEALKSLIQKIYVTVIFGFLLIGCSPTKYIGDEGVYLKQNKIKIPNHIIPQDELTPYLKQKENKKTMWVVKLRMAQYLWFNDSITLAKNDRKREKHQEKNARKFALGKDTNQFKPTTAYKLKEKGEAPVIFDQEFTDETIKQFQKALFNRGYFLNTVSANYHYNRDSNKVKVSYSTLEGPQFKYKNISLVLHDTALKTDIKLANEFSILHEGDPFNTDKIDAERQRFTSEMRNLGFYYFSKEYIEYEIDSSLSDNFVNLNIIIKSPSKPVIGSDSTQTTPHQKYKIGEITLNTSFNPKYPDDPLDSIHFEDHVFINLSRLKYNPHTFNNKLFYAKGDFYSEKQEARTYTRLTGLNNFNYINIGFTKSLDDSNVLDCNILMTPFPSQSIGIELEGTHSSGNLGVSGYLSYLHRNVFGNAEQFKARFKGGLEAQQTVSSSTETGTDIFNTIEMGVETSLIFQELILPRGIKNRILQKFNRPKTSLNLIYNYQDRPDFERNLTNASMGYMFTSNKVNTHEVFFYPADLSIIKITKTDAFEERLKELNNPLLTATYDDQFIWGTRLVETWTNKTNSQQKSFRSNRAQFELAGNVLQLMSKVFQSDQVVVVDTNTNQEVDSYYAIRGIRFAQFVKFQNDFQYNTRLKRNQFMAYRVLVGVGKTYGNARVLPYDKSFYGGGANDLRGWQARSLGPGSLADSAKGGIDQVADIKITLGMEYRFNIFKAMEGAIFADVGNIWLAEKDPHREGAEFKIDRFYKEMAVSLGTGLRFNFGFLLVRFDWGLKIHDPGLLESDRFIWNRASDFKDFYYKWTENKDADNNIITPGQFYNPYVFNLGIGYPF